MNVNLTQSRRFHNMFISEYTNSLFLIKKWFIIQDKVFLGTTKGTSFTLDKIEA